MQDYSRRGFISRGAVALATVGVGALLLNNDAIATEPSGDGGDFVASHGAEPLPIKPIGVASDFKPTDDNILGPFYRSSAPYRAKITPPLARGVVLLINGRVWGSDTRKPLPNTVIDIWQANAAGRYDNDDPSHPPAGGVFLNRARLITDENGYYEYETIHPGPYKIGPDVWRPSHIHYWVRRAGYRELITQLYFKDDPHNAKDEFIKSSLIIDVQQSKVDTTTYETGVFDIVLDRA